MGSRRRQGAQDNDDKEARVDQSRGQPETWPIQLTDVLDDVARCFSLFAIFFFLYYHIPPEDRHEVGLHLDDRAAAHHQWRSCHPNVERTSPVRRVVFFSNFFFPSCGVVALPTEIVSIMPSQPLPGLTYTLLIRSSQAQVCGGGLDGEGDVDLPSHAGAGDRGRCGSAGLFSPHHGRRDPRRVALFVHGLVPFFCNASTCFTSIPPISLSIDVLL